MDNFGFIGFTKYEAINLTRILNENKSREDFDAYDLTCINGFLMKLMFLINSIEDQVEEDGGIPVATTA